MGRGRGLAGLNRATVRDAGGPRTAVLHHMRGRQRFRWSPSIRPPTSPRHGSTTRLFDHRRAARRGSAVLAGCVSSRNPPPAMAVRHAQRMVSRANPRHPGRADHLCRRRLRRSEDRRRLPLGNGGGRSDQSQRLTLASTRMVELVRRARGIVVGEGFASWGSHESVCESVIDDAEAASATGYGLEPARTAANTCQASRAFAVRLRRM